VIIHVARDVTERKHMEARVREAEKEVIGVVLIRRQLVF